MKNTLHASTSGDAAFQEFYKEMSSDWSRRARQLRIRRERALKRAMRSRGYSKSQDFVI